MILNLSIRHRRTKSVWHSLLGAQKISNVVNNPTNMLRATLQKAPEVSSSFQTLGYLAFQYNARFPCYFLNYA